MRKCGAVEIEIDVPLDTEQTGNLASLDSFQCLIRSGGELEVFVLVDERVGHVDLLEGVFGGVSAFAIPIISSLGFSTIIASWSCHDLVLRVPKMSELTSYHVCGIQELWPGGFLAVDISVVHQPFGASPTLNPSYISGSGHTHYRRNGQIMK